MATTGPTFLGIGAQKSGTTWLHEMLKLHPGVGLPDRKELHFWDTKYPKGASLSEYDSLFTRMPQTVRGEITPGYAILPPKTIELIRNRYPRLRLLFTMRNPLERAWSNAKMFLVLQKIVPMEADVADVGDDWYIEHFLSDLSLKRGDYETCLRNWLGYFERSQLHLSLYDDLQLNARSFLWKCCAHINADPDFYVRIGDEVIHQRISATNYSAIRPSLLPKLNEIYLPKIRRLSAYLGIDLVSRWINT